MDSMDKIVIDGNKCLIELNMERNDITSDYISHYTSNGNFLSIVRNNGFMASCVKRYQSQQEKIEECFLDELFSVSFADPLEMHDENYMWEKYGDENRGVRLDFYKADRWMDMIDKKRLFELYHGDSVVETLRSNQTSNEIRGETSPCIACIDIHKQTYSDKKETLFIKKTNGVEPYLLVPAVNIENQKYEKEKEIKLVIHLSSTKLVEVKEGESLFVPINFGGLKKVVINCGVKNKHREEIKELLKQSCYANFELK